MWNKLHSSLYTVDIDGDGKEEVIFNGYSGNEGLNVRIYERNGKKFRQIFEEQQSVIQLGYYGGRLTSMVIKDPGCCSEYLVKHKKYYLEQNSKGVSFRLEKVVCYPSKTVLPETWQFDSKMVTIPVGKSIRYAPVSEDKEWNHFDRIRVKGNSIAEMTTDTPACVLGETTDGNGVLWYFVASHPKIGLFGEVFYDGAGEAPYYKCGWISSEETSALSETFYSETSNISEYTFFPYQEEFQDFVDQIQKLRSLELNNEVLDRNILETEKDLKSFYSFIIKKIAPAAEWSQLSISDDRTGKIWFLSAQIDNAMRRNNFHIAVVKENCKILFTDVSH